MEKKLKKLSLKKETISSLSGNEQRHIYGGAKDPNDGSVVACHTQDAYLTCGDDTNGATCDGTCGMTGGYTCGNQGGGDDSVNECYTVNACYSMPPHCTMTVCSARCNTDLC